MSCGFTPAYNSFNVSSVLPPCQAICSLCIFAQGLKTEFVIQLVESLKGQQSCFVFALWRCVTGLKPANANTLKWQHLYTLQRETKDTYCEGMVGRVSNVALVFSFIISLMQKHKTFFFYSLKTKKLACELCNSLKLNGNFMVYSTVVLYILYIFNADKWSVFLPCELLSTAHRLQKSQRDFASFETVWQESLLHGWHNCRPPGSCRIQVKRLIKENAVYEKRPAYRRCSWYVHAEVLSRFGLEALPVPCQWTYLTAGAREESREEPTAATGSQGNSPTTPQTSSTTPSTSIKRKSTGSMSITKFMKKCTDRDKVERHEFQLVSNRMNPLWIHNHNTWTF